MTTYSIEISYPPRAYGLMLTQTPSLLTRIGSHSVPEELPVTAYRVSHDATKATAFCQGVFLPPNRALKSELVLKYLRWLDAESLQVLLEYMVCLALSVGTGSIWTKSLSDSSHYSPWSDGLLSALGWLTCHSGQQLLNMGWHIDCVESLQLHDIGSARCRGTDVARLILRLGCDSLLLRRLEGDGTYELLSIKPVSDTLPFNELLSRGIRRLVVPESSFQHPNPSLTIYRLDVGRKAS